MKSQTLEKIAVCITTRNRREALDKCAAQHTLYRVPDAKYFIVNDAGEPTPYDDFRFTERVGIPRAKNKCLELAMECGAEHIFLFDDDCYPIADDWHLPYIQSQYKHLCYTFLPSSGIHRGHKYHSLGNGCMLYIHRSVVDRIGGFDTAFGIGKYEHTQFSHRAYNAGFCPYPYMDVMGSEHLFYSMDEHAEIERSMTEEEMNIQLECGYSRFYHTISTTLYCDFST